MKVRYCVTCKKNRPLSEFSKRKRGSGLYSKCNACLEYFLNWEKENKDRRIRYNRERFVRIHTTDGLRDIELERLRDYKKKTRKRFLDMYGGKCICCGETIEEFLTIEHKNGQSKTTREGSMRAYLKAIKEYRPDLYEVLCMNCNHAKGRYGICPHQRVVG